MGSSKKFSAQDLAYFLETHGPGYLLGLPYKAAASAELAVLLDNAQVYWELFEAELMRQAEDD